MLEVALLCMQAGVFSEQARFTYTYTFIRRSGPTPHRHHMAYKGRTPFKLLTRDRSGRPCAQEKVPGNILQAKQKPCRQ